MITIHDVARETAQHFKLSRELMFSRRRDHHISHPRQVALMFAREYTSHSLTKIGRTFGMDHTSVLHAIRAVQARVISDDEFKVAVADVRARLEALKTSKPITDEKLRRINEEWTRFIAERSKT